MGRNRFRTITDEMFEFYTSCKESGFTDFQAGALTEKVYAVSLTIQQLKEHRVSKRDIMRRADILNTLRKEQHMPKSEEEK